MPILLCTLALFAPALDGDRALPSKLRGLPVGILALHHPNPCYPVPEGDHFVWAHDTTVQSIVGDLRVVEYGAYLYRDAGWTLRATMGAADFAKEYGCPGGRLKKGKTYRNPENGRRSDKPVAGDALWFFIAEDAKGQRFKGTALVETEGPKPTP